MYKALIQTLYLFLKNLQRATLLLEFPIFKTPASMSTVVQSKELVLVLYSTVCKRMYSTLRTRTICEQDEKLILKCP